MDDIQKLDNVIETMFQLKQLEKKLRQNHGSQGDLLIKILILIESIEIPNITLLQNFDTIAMA